MAPCSSSSKSEKKKNNQGKAKTNYNKKVKTRTKAATLTPTQCTNSRGVRLIRGRIYDSQNGKTCHQCRKKATDFVVPCKKKTENKQCTIHFCQRCLLNRYEEKAEEVAALHNWACPRCRGICNCSSCMKKQGHNPTGLVVRVAKENSFSSMSKMPQLKDSGNLGSKTMMDADGPSKKRKSSNEESDVSLAKGHREGNDYRIPSHLKLNALPSELNVVGIETRSRKLQRLKENNRNENVSVEERDVDFVTEENSPKRHQISKAVGKGFRKPSNSKAQLKPSKVRGTGIETRNSKLKQLEAKKDAVSLAKRHREMNDYQRPSNLKVQAQSSQMNGRGIETRSSKLQRLRDNNRSENVFVEEKHDVSVTKESSLKSHQVSKPAGNGFQNPSNSKVQQKPSKVRGTGIETRNSKLKRLEDNKAASLIRKCGTKIRQTSKAATGGKEKIYRMDLDGQLTKMNSDIEVPKMDFQESIFGQSETEVPNNVDVGDSVAKRGQVKGSHSCENIVEVKKKLSNMEIPLPHGIILSNVASVDMSAEDVGLAFQFLEFCKAFRKVLNLRKGQSEHFLRELAGGRIKRRAHSSPVVKFHIQLLSVIQKDSRKEYPYFQNLSENSWFQALVKYISESRFYLKDLQVDCFELGNYDLLDVSKKLKLLNFLCDEALGTTDFRSWIDEQSKFVERDKKGKEKVLVEKEKFPYKKIIKSKKQHDGIAKAGVMNNGAPLSMVAQTLQNTVEASGAMFNVMPKEELESGALRSEPTFSDEHGRRFWRFRCYSGEMDVLLQDIEKGNPCTAKERWYAYGIEQKDLVEKYICSFRKLGT
ncbi:Zinc-finger domain of monoamine-oxidase A repressor R1 protein [Melia azedarach]|uniref:Zinc-finger domain of monoamine-oxidase A repressor R1 protein n=1 Tax=Melia azedarach TaxID=155640 RepID=A0ACC1XPE1_MELAZ|nr:Zinc-finger domain of monoamine-oxidase A repressor R1 protein [Melia azedarach]